MVKKDLKKAIRHKKRLLCCGFKATIKNNYGFL